MGFYKQKIKDILAQRVKWLRPGYVVRLKKDIPALSCWKGMMGVICYKYSGRNGWKGENYTGVQVIFENGSLDGFSVNYNNFDDEVSKFLEVVGYSTNPEIRSYKFLNVHKVVEDFNDGFWEEVLERKAYGNVKDDRQNKKIRA